MKMLLATAFLAVASGAAAQQRPDTLVAPDSVGVSPIPAELAGIAQALADSARVHTLPQIDGRPRAGADTEVWIFERSDLLAMKGLSLADLLAEVPGVTRLRGGDYGAPEAVTAYGLAGGGVRVFWDGFEQITLDGAVPDFAHIGLGGVERVRVERHPGELRIELVGLRDEDPRAMSLVEAGTGDYGTNFFTGTFLHPRAVGGSFGLALDRIDTDGPNGEDGSRTGGWIRYHRFFGGDGLALTAEARRMKSTAAITGYPGESTRVDWVVRGRWLAAPGLSLQAFTGRSGLDGYDRTGRVPVDRDRRQHGLIADLARGPVHAEAALRLFGGPAVPSRSLDLSATADLPELGGARAAVSSESWGGDIATFSRIGAWTRPLAGLSLFASRESGSRGLALYPLPPLDPPTPKPGEDPAEPDPEPEPGHRRAERSAVRLGARFAWRGADVSAARVTLDTDSLPLLGLPMDREGIVLPGIARTGLELSGRVPLPLVPEGFAVTGGLTVWNEGARYLPKRSYVGYFVFHRQYKESGNIEVWGRLGVEGRGPMAVPVGDPTIPVTVGQPPEPVVQPFYQSWHALVQVRVVALRVFVAWENFSVRRNNQDFPGRVLPIFRSHYGVRWMLWN
ncbi:MAG: hypothetical protein EXR95_00970 [Gemmatimonadetes bacterium]|nr:hypothetical protein [Gemmatimonadota bacterium]